MTIKDYLDKLEECVDRISDEDLVCLVSKSQFDALKAMHYAKIENELLEEREKSE